MRELSISGAVEFTPRQFSDDRGLFTEWYRFEALRDAIGHPIELRQANLSVSHRGVVRGIHYADVPPSQAKYVTVMSGAIIDYVVDIRVGSLTYGQHEAVMLDASDRRALYIGEGLGHCFVALSDNTVVSYLVSEVFTPDREHGINPFDETIGLDYPLRRSELIVSPKDLEAPTLVRAEQGGLLPLYADAVAYAESLTERWRA